MGCGIRGATDGVQRMQKEWEKNGREENGREKNGREKNGQEQNGREQNGREEWRYLERENSYLPP